MDFRKLVAPALALILAGSVGGGIWYSHHQVNDDRSAAEAASAERASHVELRGQIGSEKESYFADPSVQKALARLGITTLTEKVGSRTIVNNFDAKKYDFGFPSGAPAAAALRQKAKVSTVYTPFYTPIVFASWRPIAEILVSNGIAQREGDVYYVTDLPALIGLVAKGTRWRELKASTAFPTNKAVLVNSTDVRTSNSAAMYLSLASYIVNEQQVVESQQDLDRVLPIVAPLFLHQGFQESSSAAPFEDYLALGMGKSPMLVAYESQLIEFWLRHPDRIKSDMVILYPRPTVFSKHVLVPYTPAGARLGAALETDAELQRLAHEYGYRTGGTVKGPEEWAKRGIAVPEVLVDVIDPPSYEWLERMIQDIESRFK